MDYAYEILYLNKVENMTHFYNKAFILSSIKNFCFVFYVDVFCLHCLNAMFLDLKMVPSREFLRFKYGISH